MALVARAVRSSGAKIVAGGFRADTFSMAELRCDHIATTIEDGVAYVRSAFGLKPGPKTKPPTASQQ
jgi:hypothetical protein